ncbi:MAG: GC-type dockerin domain-anchored protein [Phycisphaerales bacterium JB064]
MLPLWNDKLSRCGSLAVLAAGFFALAAPVRPALAQCDPLSEPFPAAIDLTSLDGQIGVRFAGAQSNRPRAVGGVVDINGDGFDDAFIADQTLVYVVFGRGPDDAFPAFLELGRTPLPIGFEIRPESATGAPSAMTVSHAGDVNSDGLEDIIIGNPGATIDGRSGVGAAYVIFGRDAGDPPFPDILDLSALDASTGFRMVGALVRDWAGYDVCAAGDLNSDGIGDVIVGAPRLQDRVGECYVVFGRPPDDPFPVSFSLGDLDGNNGFKINGTQIEDFLGQSACVAGDLNGDGIDDVIMGAAGSSASGQDYAGSCFIVYGRPSGTPFPAALALDELDGTDGFRLDGTGRRDLVGQSVASAGDLNGDGRDDAIIGAPGRNTSYVIYGRDAGDPFPARLTIDDIDGTNGFAIMGIDTGDASGSSVSSAGDANGDGLPDVIIGAPGADPIRQESAGETSIVFGRPAGSPFPAVLHLADLDGRHGVRLDGLDPGDRSGLGVGTVDDLNSDGVDDVIISAPDAVPFFGSGISNGETYVVFGRKPRSCPQDIDCDDTLTLIDFLAYHVLFDRRDPRADFDSDGDFTIFDFLAFQNAFDAGCP